MAQEKSESQQIPAAEQIPQTEEALAVRSSETLAPLERYALTVRNPTVLAVSKAFHWRPETVIARVERALPAKFEQQVYLAVAEGFRIRPESLAKLLAIWRGPKPLSINDLERREVGKNVVTNSFGNFVDFFEACMSLVKVVSKEYEAFALSMELAAHIVLAFGVNQPEALIEMVDTNLDECCEFFGVSRHHPYSWRMQLCVWNYVVNLLPKLRERGVPDVFDPDEFLGNEDLRRRCLYDALGVNQPEERDYSQELREIMEGGGIL